MKKILLYFLCLLIIFTSMSCDYSEQTRLTRQFIDRTEEEWRSTDERICIFLSGMNPMEAVISVRGIELSCFCLIWVRGPMYFTTINVCQNNSDFVRWQNSDDYDILKFDYSFSDKGNQLIATVKYDWLDKYGYEKLYNEGDVVTFRRYPDAS